MKLLAYATPSKSAEFSLCAWSPGEHSIDQITSHQSVQLVLHVYHGSLCGEYWPFQDYMKFCQFHLIDQCTFLRQPAAVDDPT